MLGSHACQVYTSSEINENSHFEIVTIIEILIYLILNLHTFVPRQMKGRVWKSLHARFTRLSSVHKLQNKAAH